MRNLILISITYILSVEFKEDYNPYKILELSEEATPEEIKKKFKKESIKYHPDKIKTKSNAAELENKFKEINTAYEILSDKKKKQIQDLKGAEGLNLLEGNQRGGGDMDSIFGSIFGGGGGFGGFGGFGGGGLRQGQSKQFQYQVSLEDIQKGAELKFQFQRQNICTKCKGTGSSDGHTHKCDKCKGKGVTISVQKMGQQTIQYQSQCDKCGGRGSIVKNKCPVCSGRKLLNKQATLEVIIEKGTPNGHQIQYEMESDHVLDGFPGDVFLKILEKKHKTFERRGDDLYMTKKITLKEALTGVQFFIDHLDGNQIVIKEDKIINTKFTTKVQGKGMPKHEVPSEFGNLIINQDIEFPKQLTQDQKNQIIKIL